MYVHSPPHRPASGGTQTPVQAVATGSLLAALIFLLVFFYFWIGLDPLPDSTLIDPTKAYGGKSNRLNQIVVLLMAGIVLVTLLGKPSRTFLMRPWTLMMLVFGWLFFADLFAGDPGTALRRTVFALIVCMCSSAALLIPKSRDQFVTLVTFGLIAMLGLAYLTVTVLPQVGIHQATDPLEAQLAGDWRAHFGHKNAAASAMAFSFFFGLYIAKARSFLVGCTIAVLSFVFLVKSGSKTSTAIVPAILVVAWLYERWKGGRILMVTGGLLTVNTILMSAATSKPVQDFLESVGIDPTFTERTDIWQLALHAIGQSPLTGYGLQSFWQTDALFRSTSAHYTWAVTAANSHNGYVELLINGGIPLFILGVIWLVFLPIGYSNRALKSPNDPLLTRLFLRIWLYALFLACLESAFFVNEGPIWFSILIGVFGLRLQANGTLVESTASPLRQQAVPAEFSRTAASANPR